MRPRTVVGYLSRVIATGSGAPLPAPMDFIGRVLETNANLPANPYLLCGDGNLEPMAPAIAGTAAQPVLVPGSEPWKWVHSIFRALIDNLVANSQRDWVVFVDTNPSFSIYTELAGCAVNRLITPINADDISSGDQCDVRAASRAESATSDSWRMELCSQGHRSASGGLCFACS